MGPRSNRTRANFGVNMLVDSCPPTRCWGLCGLIPLPSKGESLEQTFLCVRPRAIAAWYRNRRCANDTGKKSASRSARCDGASCDRIESHRHSQGDERSSCGSKVDDVHGDHLL